MTMPISQTDARSTRNSRRYVILLAGLLLGVPVAAVALRASRNMHEQGVRAVVPQRAPAAADIATLEARARAMPSAENQLNLSVGYINADAPGQAIPILMSLVAEDKNNGIAWNDLCVAYNLKKDYRRGIAACTEALRIDPRFQLAANNLKWGMDEEQKQPGSVSIPAVRSAAPLSGQDVSLYMDQGLRQLNAGDYDAAIALWQRILAADPANALAANNIGTALMFKKEPTAALEWFQMAVKSNPSLQIARNNIAWAADEASKSRR